MKRFTSFLLIALVLLSTIAVSCAPASVALKDPIKIDTGLVSGQLLAKNRISMSTKAFLLPRHR